MRALGLAALVAVASSCAGAQPRTVSLRVRGDVRDAVVTVDDEYIGALSYVAERGVALPPGKHRITVQKVGYFPWDKEVDAVRETIHLDVVLTKVPD